MRFWLKILRLLAIPLLLGPIPSCVLRRLPATMRRSIGGRVMAWRDDLLEERRKQIAQAESDRLTRALRKLR